MSYETIKTLSPAHFKRYCGVQPETFQRMCEVARAELKRTKKKRHTIKSQVIINRRTRAVICTAHRPGRTHDFALFKEASGEIAASIRLLGDSGYQGLRKEHGNSQTPQKKPKGRELTPLQKR